jgi:hypothetical protein
MKADLVYAPHGETIQLPVNLSAVDVEVINSKNLAVVVDESAHTQEYRRHFERSKHPSENTIDLPDGAVVAKWDGDSVDYLEPTGN